MIKYVNVFDMRFIGRALHNFTFHDNFAHFSYVNGLLCNVEEIMQITCPAFHVHPMSSKFALTDSYMYNQRTNGPVNPHLISCPNKAQNIQNLEIYGKEMTLTFNTHIPS